MTSEDINIHRCRFVDYTPHTITAVAFSHASNLNQVASNDLRLAVGRSNGDIEIWNPKHNWTHELTLYGSKDRSVEGLCWSVTEADPTPRLFSVGGSTHITEWDLKTGLPKTNYDCNVGVIWSVAINKAGTKLAVGSNDGAVCVIDISGGFGSLEHHMICQRQDLKVLSIKWFEDLIVGGCSDARIRCWSTSKDDRGRILGTMRVDKSKTESTLVWSINILEKRRQIVSGDSTGTVKIWDLDHFSLLQSFQNHEADILCITNDANEEKIFTAGVDRRIHQFNLINMNNKNSTKWVHSYNRLLHSNDVRSMAVFESKGYNFLISGGVEKSIVIQSLNQFHDGKYRKLSLNQQHDNILFNQQQMLVVMWQEQTVKIWKMVENNYKLVAKMSLSDEENITNVSINKDASLLVVSTMTSVKVFELLPSGNKLLINKFRHEDFDSIISGAKQVLVYDQTLLILTANEELYKFVIDVEARTIDLDSEIDFDDVSNKEFKSALSYQENIKQMVLSPEQDVLIITRFNGVVQAINLGDNSNFTLITLSYTPHLVEFSSASTLLVISPDNKLYEFSIKNTTSTKPESLITEWSKRNSEFLPKQFLTLEDKPEGLFTTGTKAWIYGKSWLCYFDLALNIPINKFYKNTVTKKRNRDGLTIDEEEDEDEEDENINMMEASLRQTQINKLKQQEQETKEDEKPYWISFKYRPILSVDKVDDDELILIERPFLSLPSTPAFNLPKIKV